MLAARYGKGYVDIPKDCSQSIYWFTRAAEQGSALGQFSLAMAYEQGDCVQQSHNQAVKWFKAAAQQNIPYCSGNACAEILSWSRRKTESS